jgi:hypothetical protein
VSAIAGLRKEARMSENTRTSRAPEKAGAQPTPGQGGSGGRGVRSRLVRFGARPNAGSPALEPVLQAVRTNHPRTDLTVIERASETAERAHRGQLARLAQRHDAAAPGCRQRGADQEPPRLHARDQVDAARRARHVPERIDDVTEGLAVGEEPGDVAEGDAGPGVVGHGADELEHAGRSLRAETGEADGPQAVHLAGRRVVRVRHRGRRRRGCALLPRCSPGWS